MIHLLNVSRRVLHSLNIFGARVTMQPAPEPQPIPEGTLKDSAGYYLKDSAGFFLLDSSNE